MNNVSARDVALDPEWIPHTYDLEGANLVSVLVPPEARSELTFLSDEYFGGNFRKVAFPAPIIAAEASNARQAPIHFIFHTSFCCSTLLANLLEVPKVTSLMKEPDVLINLANRLIRSNDRENRERLELVVRLLERPFGSGEKVIVKPSNFGNRLADIILASRPGSRAVLLYSDVETLLLSLVKRGMFGRIFGRRLFNQLRGWSPLDFGYGPSELLEQTDVQIAALAWLMQIHHFDALARSFGDRVMVVDSATLLSDPVATIQTVEDLFGLGLAPTKVVEIANGPAFSRHSKSAVDYGIEARVQEHNTAASTHSEEIGMVAQWIKAVADQMGIPLQPGS
jgi:hypothetical protein